MEKNNYLILSDEFLKYCKLNNIEDVNKFAKEVFNKGFTSVKYGDQPILKEAPKKDLLIKKIKKEEKINKPKKDIYGDD